MRKIFNHSLWFSNGFLVGITVSILTIWGLGSLCEWATAATYNVFFNNVEQGANSSASPTVQLSGTRSEAPAPATAVLQPAAPVIPSPVTPAIETQELPPSVIQSHSSSTTLLPQTAEATSFRRTRLSFLTDSVMSQGEDLSSNPIGGTLRASFYPVQDFAISALAGAGSSRPFYYGAELEFDALHLGVFGLERFLNVGFVAGATTLGQGENFGTVHGGVETELNLGDRFALTAGLRTNLTDRSTVKYLMADAGVSVRF